jgi:DNA-binding transcriptional LysR family regulator
MRGSDFAELRAFAAIVERGSFARAADHLGMSASALSQTIRQLETRLRTRLLNRTTRSVAPTAAGARLYDRLLPTMQELDAAVTEAMAATGRAAGTLRISAASLAVKLIVPRLGRFHAQHPDVVLDVVVDDSLTDIVAGRFDAGIRVGQRLEKDMVAVRLTADRQMQAVASPDYLARHGEPKTPADLQHHRCINWRFPGSGNIHRRRRIAGARHLLRLRRRSHSPGDRARAAQARAGRLVADSARPLSLLFEQALFAAGASRFHRLPARSGFHTERQTSNLFNGLAQATR